MSLPWIRKPATPPSSCQSQRDTSRGGAGVGVPCVITKFRTLSCCSECIGGEAREVSAVGQTCAHAGSGEHVLKILHYYAHQAIATGTATPRAQRERWAGPAAGAPNELTVRRMVWCRSTAAPDHCEHAQPAAHMGGHLATAWARREKKLLACEVDPRGHI